MDLNNIEFWSSEKLVETVSTLLAQNPNFEKQLGEEISKYLKKSTLSDNSHDKTSKAWLSWCSQQKSRVKASYHFKHSVKVEPFHSSGIWGGGKLFMYFSYSFCDFPRILSVLFILFTILR